MHTATATMAAVTAAAAAELAATAELEATATELTATTIAAMQLSPTLELEATAAELTATSMTAMAVAAASIVSEVTVSTACRLRQVNDSNTAHWRRIYSFLGGEGLAGYLYNMR